jgi:hypothetical protein
MYFTAPLAICHAQPHYSRIADNPQQIGKMQIFKLGLQENFTFAKYPVIHYAKWQY